MSSLLIDQIKKIKSNNFKKNGLQFVFSCYLVRGTSCKAGGRIKKMVRTSSEYWPHQSDKETNMVSSYSIARLLKSLTELDKQLYKSPSFSDFIRKVSLFTTKKAKDFERRLGSSVVACLSPLDKGGVIYANR